MREDVEQALKEYKIKTFGNKKNIAALESRIPQDETVRFVTFANFTWPNPTYPDRPAMGTGALAITDNAVYVDNTALAAPFEKTQETYSISDLQMASCKATGMTGAQFDFVFSDIHFIAAVGFYQKALSEKLFNLILELNTELKASASPEPGVSAAAAIPEFAPLNVIGRFSKAVMENMEKSPAIDVTEELRKYKSLLDDGVISQEEFNQKKQQLLNL